jgi:hypothetical protein
MIGITTILRLSGIAVLLIIVSAAWSYASKLSEVQKDYDALAQKLRLLEAREAGHLRQIERRDAAINASTCKQKITYWVSHPDDIPQPFDPFNQLVPPNLRGK